MNDDEEPKTLLDVTIGSDGKISDIDMGGHTDHEKAVAAELADDLKTIRFVSEAPPTGAAWAR